jgi:transcriptional regulator with XRE-family HTH domain
MAKKRASPRLGEPDWYLTEWMDSLHMTQAELGRRTGWGKARCNEIYHGVTGYYRQILNEAAAALNIEPWELLMSPAEARALLRMRRDALTIAAEQRIPFTPAPPEDLPLNPKRKVR